MSPEAVPLRQPSFARDEFSGRTYGGQASTRSVWATPSFYLVLPMCAYLFGAMWLINGLTWVRRRWASVTG